MDGQDRVVSGDFDLLVLDLGLPKKEGLKVVPELRVTPDAGGAIGDIPTTVSSGHARWTMCLEAGWAFSCEWYNLVCSTVALPVLRLPK